MKFINYCKLREDAGEVGGFNHLELNAIPSVVQKYVTRDTELNNKWKFKNPSKLYGKKKKPKNS